jgi:hypothetical protein
LGYRQQSRAISLTTTKSGFSLCTPLKFDDLSTGGVAMVWFLQQKQGKMIATLWLMSIGTQPTL